MTSPIASSGGTEYWLPLHGTNACRETLLGSDRTAGYGAAGAARRDSVAATVSTDDFPFFVARIR
ncbi:hypothetical protein ACFQW5_24345 [Tsukamurella soli]|uniref:hypothetical protein n=1 Tax=Tsukamurella soli TaxID=644556 RepID=UPI00361BF29C